MIIKLDSRVSNLGSGRDQHTNIGDGFIGTEELRRLVNHHRFAGLPLILEVPGLEGKGPDKESIDRVIFFFES